MYLKKRYAITSGKQEIYILLFLSSSSIKVVSKDVSGWNARNWARSNGNWPIWRPNGHRCRGLPLYRYNRYLKKLLSFFVLQTSSNSLIWRENVCSTWSSTSIIRTLHTFCNWLKFTRTIGCWKLYWGIFEGKHYT